MRPTANGEPGGWRVLFPILTAPFLLLWSLIVLLYHGLWIVAVGAIVVVFWVVVAIILLGMLGLVG